MLKHNTKFDSGDDIDDDNDVMKTLPLPNQVLNVTLTLKSGCHSETISSIYPNVITVSPYSHNTNPSLLVGPYA